MKNTAPRLVTHGLAVSLIVGAAFVLGGCDDILGVIDPCSKDGACEVEGISFVVDELSTNGTMIEALNRRVLEAGSEMVISYRVRNRGDQASNAQELRICVAGGFGCSDLSQRINLDPMDPGDRVSGSVTFNLPSTLSGTREVRAMVNHSSHSRTTEEVTFELPDFRSELRVLEGEVPAGEHVPAEVTIRNETHVATAPPSRAGLCLSERISPRCLSGHDLQGFDVPALAAGETWTDTIQYAIPMAALAFPDDRTNRRLSVLANANEAVSEGSTNYNWAHASFTVWPNLDKGCAVTDISPGQEVSSTLNPTGCDLRWNRGADVYRLEVEAGRLYRFQIKSDDENEYRWSGLVLSHTGTEIASFVANTSSSRTTHRIIDFTAVESGTYHVVVGYAWSTQLPSGQPYRMSVVHP